MTFIIIKNILILYHFKGGVLLVYNVKSIPDFYSYLDLTYKICFENISWYPTSIVPKVLYKVNTTVKQPPKNKLLVFFQCIFSCISILIRSGFGSNSLGFEAIYALETFDSIWDHNWYYSKAYMHHTTSYGSSESG